MTDRDHPGPHDPDCWCGTYTDCGYEFCRAHAEWHRPPECPIDANGEPAPTWADDAPTQESANPDCAPSGAESGSLPTANAVGGTSVVQPEDGGE